jgi:hypothetical protein
MHADNDDDVCASCVMCAHVVKEYVVEGRGMLNIG